MTLSRNQPKSGSGLARTLAGGRLDDLGLPNPPPQPEVAAVVRDCVLNGDGDTTGGVACIDLLDLLRCGGPRLLHWNAGQRAHVRQGRIEWKEDFVPHSDAAGGLAGLI